MPNWCSLVPGKATHSLAVLSALDCEYPSFI
jgi:hypothetical protein